MRDDEKGMLAAIIGIVFVMLCWAAFWISAIWCAVHFIRKWW